MADVDGRRGGPAPWRRPRVEMTQPVFTLPADPCADKEYRSPDCRADGHASGREAVFDPATMTGETSAFAPLCPRHPRTRSRWARACRITVRRPRLPIGLTVRRSAAWFANGVRALWPRRRTRVGPQASAGGGAALGRGTNRSGGTYTGFACRWPSRRISGCVRNASSNRSPPNLVESYRQNTTSR